MVTVGINNQGIGASLQKGKRFPANILRVLLEKMGDADE